MGVNKKVYVGVPGLEEANHALKEHYAQGHKVVKTTTSGGSLTAFADHRDARRRGVGLHPDQRDLDHRRPDLPSARPLLRGRPAGDRRRHQRLPRRRQGPDPGDEEGRRRPAARPGCLPRARGVRPARHRARQGDAETARPRLPHGRTAEAAAVPADERHRPGHEHLRGHPGLSRRRAASRKSRAGRPRSSTFIRERKPEIRDRPRAREEADRQDRVRPEGAPSTEFKRSIFIDGHGQARHRDWRGREPDRVRSS